ncbi:MAG: hypothetical protein ACRD5R_07905 [Candidatus Acidiferrales bacterium]
MKKVDPHHSEIHEPVHQVPKGVGAQDSNQHKSGKNCANPNLRQARNEPLPRGQRFKFFAISALVHGASSRKPNPMENFPTCISNLRQIQAPMQDGPESYHGSNLARCAPGP